MKIKALSLWQPWASLIAVGAKKYETRSWKTDYRGPLLICAAKKPFNLGEYDKNFENKARDALMAILMKGKTFVDLPYGQALAVASLTDCTITFNYQTDWIGLEATFGDFSPGRYAWKLENVRQIEPFPVKGRQGLFEVTVRDDLLTGGNGRYVVGHEPPCYK